jgi:hyperosmotically inducible periplasmic protein
MTISDFRPRSKRLAYPLLLVVAGALFSGVCFAQAAPGRVVQNSTEHNDAWLAQEVRHQLLLVPWYSVFDNLEFKVNGSEVTLLGQTVNPTLKHDAENAVKNIEGVTKVNNNIEVLPVSPMDDSIRRAIYHAIYEEPQLQRYAMGSLPAIHIIVKGGHVTLVGWVASQGDKDLAGIRAMGVPNVFSVTNNLRVESAARS